MNFFISTIILILLQANNGAAQEINGINFFWSTIGIIVSVIIALLTLFFYGGKQHQRLNNLEEDSSKNIKPSIQKIDAKIDNNIIPALSNISNGISFLQGKIDNINTSKVTKSKSPLVLNEQGIKILTESGIDKIIEDNYNSILSTVKNNNPPNAFQAQESIIDAVKELLNDPKLKNAIEIGAFSCGSDVETVLFVGAINVRDRILTELKLYPQDIDVHDPSKN